MKAVTDGDKKGIRVESIGAPKPSCDSDALVRTAGERDQRLWVPRLVAAALIAAGSMLATSDSYGSKSGDCAQCPQMIRIAGGDFLMGIATGYGPPEESPVHKVHVKAFQAGQYEVTFEEWDACAAAGACSAEVIDEGWGRARRPVINVDWNDAQTYVHWLSARTGRRFRLLTEAEWEFAARAGASTVFPWGDVMVPGKAVCYSDCGDEADESAVAGSTPPNAFGLYDMQGNVWEWVEDCWHGTYDGAPADGSAWTDGECAQRVARGGGWLNWPRDVRASIRVPQPTSIRYNTLGFRVASDD